MKRRETVDTSVGITSVLSSELQQKAKTLQIRKTDSDASKAEKIRDVLQGDFLLKRIFHATWTALRDKMSSKDNPKEEFRAAVMKFLEDGGYKQAILNMVNGIYHIAIRETVDVYTLLGSTARRTIDEPIVPVRNARFQWENGIYDEVLAMTVEGKRPFAVQMPSDWINPLIEKVFTFEYRDSIRFLFDSDDLLETAVNIVSTNYAVIATDESLCPSLGMLKIALHTPIYVNFTKKFRELSQEFSHVGLDDSYSMGGNRFLQHRQEEAEMILKIGSFQDARDYLRRGSLPAIRGRIWRLALGLPPDETPDEAVVFASLLQDVNRFDYITDELFVMDVLNIVDDPNYFIFDETLREVVLAFSRDTYVRENSSYEIYRIVSEELTMPSAVQPFLGLACYFAPLGYVIRRGPAFYSLSREIYCQLWCKMTVLSGDTGTLLHVCKTFESLLLEAHPRLFLHLVNIGIQPLQIAFQWIQLGYVGFLEVDQLLLLWDRILGYNDTSLLAVFAAAVFVFRAESLLSCNSPEFAERMLREFSRVKVIPLLQIFFMSNNPSPSSTTS